jgi:asparagine synthase (glutamine-hydrolysing)
MCAIAGVVGFPGESQASVLRKVLVALDVLRHRGPDDGGLISGTDHVLGYRRLAIRGIGKRANEGRQPFRSPGASVVLFGVGEVYNAAEVHSTSGVDVTPRGGDLGALLSAFLARGPAGLAGIQGEFACAIWDSCTSTLTLARDSCGTKPLFYSASDGELRFASEVKGLAALGVRLGADPETVAAFLRFNYPIPPRTFYREVQSVPPGSAVSWRGGTLTMSGFADLACVAETVAGSDDHDTLGIERVLTRAVSSRLTTDRPLGFHLSGGVDSSLVCHVADRPGTPAYTVGYQQHRAGEDAAGDGDLWWAAAVARELGLRHRTIIVPVREAIACVDPVIDVLDSPIMSPGAITPYLVAQRARRDGVTVLVEGQGSDEVFLGYRRHAQVGSPGLDSAELAANTDLTDLHRLAPSLPEIVRMADSRYRELSADVAHLGPLVAFQVSYMRGFLHEILRIEDHAHLAHSVENRPPFLDGDVVSLGLRSSYLLGRRSLGKPQLKMLLSARRSVAATRPAKQQMTPPMDQVAQWATAYLRTSAALEPLDGFDRDAILRLAAEPLTRRQQRLLWALANLARWSARSGIVLSM